MSDWRRPARALARRMRGGLYQSGRDDAAQGFATAGRNVPNFGNFTFSPNAKTTVKGTNGGNAAVPLPSGSFFYVHSLSPNLKLGFGSYSYFGAPLEYNLNWVGRYHLQGATMLGMSFQPSIAFRAADWLSIGGGPNVMMGFLRAKAGINTLNPRLGDGQVRYQNWTVNVGGNVGILLTPRDGTRIGMDYLTPVNLNFSDAPISLAWDRW